MAYNAKILADSISQSGHRLTTFECTYPRIIHQEFLTHRMLSRNSASSRAIPVDKRIQAVANDPFIPEAFGKNQKGMVAEEALDSCATSVAKELWTRGLGRALVTAKSLEGINVHKQLANRVFEPYSWITVIVTATDWDNFFQLRTASDAQPELRKIALMMQDAYTRSEPLTILAGWHLPLVNVEEINSVPDRTEYWKKVSIGRCARVSYLTHDRQRDPDADVALYERLLESGHMSPFEHVARPFTYHEWAIINDIQNVKSWRGDPFAFQLQKKIEYVGNLHGYISARMEIEYDI